MARVTRVGAGLLGVTLLLLPIGGLIAADTRLGFNGPDPGLAGSIAVVGLFCITLCRPADGVLLCAALLPIGFQLGAMLDSPVGLGEPLLLAFLASWIVRETVRPQQPSDRRVRTLLTPAFLLAAVVVASILVALLVEQVSADYPWPFARTVIAGLVRDYLFDSGRFGPGALVLEGIGLFVAVVLLDNRQPGVARRVLSMVSVGATAVAALNLVRLAEISLRAGGSMQAFRVIASTVRISASFPDANAAGSYMAMMVLVTLGLAAASRSFRWARIGAAALMTASLCLTGSRTAVVAAALVGVAALVWLARNVHSSDGRRAAVVTLAVVVVVAMLGGLFVRRDMGRGVLDTVRWRIELNEAALRAAIAHPVFGVGVGRYWWESERYIDPAARQVLPRENAHNNYIQIFAELGLAGLIPFSWLLVAIARRVKAAGAAGVAGDWTFAGTIAGVLAFLVTCLAGHPLLIREVSNQFWLVLGSGAALSLACVSARAERAERALRAPRLLLIGASICLAISVPIRAHQITATEINVEHAALGFSAWQIDEQGVRFRTMTGRATFYAPVNTCEVRVLLQVERPIRTGVDVEVWIDGRLANRVRAVADAWREMRMVLPIGSGRIRTVELRAPRGDITVRAGKPAIAICDKNPF